MSNNKVGGFKQPKMDKKDSSKSANAHIEV
ncbi:hypothetical protein Salpa_1577 [Sporomusa sp. KB1]|jgi:hypothetical protein|nr:hypothetical protein Salpa_1577 [Sporomusa sp. KB1]